MQRISLNLPPQQADLYPNDLETALERLDTVLLRAASNPWVSGGAIAVFVALVVFFRFFVTSPLWLDEALTVHISSLPVGEMFSALKRDGAPPLYYLLLHEWMKAFGNGAVATRSLSVVLSLLAALVVYFTGRIMFGPACGLAAALILSSSAFYDTLATSVRMYVLVVPETALVILGLFVGLAKLRPFAGALFCFLGSASLLYTHYWGLFAYAVTWAVVVGAFLLGQRRASLALSGGLLLAAGCFIPWLPTFLFQLRHTGTPWSAPVSPTALVNAFTSVAGGDTAGGRLAAVATIGLFVLAVLGEPASRATVLLKFSTVRRSRLLAAATLIVLGLAVGVSVLARSAYQPRYAAVGLAGFILCCSAGLLALRSATLRSVAVAWACAAGFLGCINNSLYQRTEAGLVASYINAHASQRDVVLFCPDQLGPAVTELERNRALQVAFPSWRDPSPRFVDWIDYAKRNTSAQIQPFLGRLLALRPRTVFYVWEEGYLTYGTDCEQIYADLVPHSSGILQAVRDQPQKYYEHEHLTVFHIKQSPGG